MKISFPKGVKHYPNHLSSPAYSCEDAIRLRGILNDEELKTLIFTSKKGNYVFHLLSNKRVNLHSFTKETGHLKLMNSKILAELGFNKGNINPFNFINSQLQIKIVYICTSLFSKKYLYTNDGTNYGTIKFSPNVLEKLYSKFIVRNVSKN